MARDAVTTVDALTDLEVDARFGGRPVRLRIHDAHTAREQRRHDDHAEHERELQVVKAHESRFLRERDHLALLHENAKAHERHGEHALDDEQRCEQQHLRPEGVVREVVVGALLHSAERSPDAAPEPHDRDRAVHAVPEEYGFELVVAPRGRECPRARREREHSEREGEQMQRREREFHEAGS